MLSEFDSTFNSDTITFIDKINPKGYVPKIEEGKLVGATLYVGTGPANTLETCCHETAHLIDIIFRKCPIKFLTMPNYGMPFYPTTGENQYTAKQYIRGLKIELGVATIQSKLLNMAGYTWEEVEDIMRLTISSFNATGYLLIAKRKLTELHGTDALTAIYTPQALVNGARLIATDDIYAAWAAVNALMSSGIVVD